MKRVEGFLREAIPEDIIHLSEVEGSEEESLAMSRDTMSRGNGYHRPASTGIYMSDWENKLGELVVSICVCSGCLFRA